MRTRTEKLHRNFRLMFLVQAFTSVQVMNVISTIFLIHRGLTLSQILYLSIIFSIVTLCLEVPSSYLADKWGRKQVIIISVLLSLLYWVLNIYAYSFAFFVLVIAVNSASEAFLSGTDEALIYDTTRELNLKDQSLKRLGKYFSGQRIFKLIVPFVAVLIAKNLSDAQFITILLIDVVANFIALGASFFLTEPHHFMTVEKVEARIMHDAIGLFRQHPALFQIMMNKTMMFIAMFMLWRINSDFFVDVMKVPLLTLGFVYAGYQGVCFLSNWYVDKLFTQVPLNRRINLLNLICTLSLYFFFVASFMTAHNSLLLVLFAVCMVSEQARWPLFSQLFNSASESYNRATVLSLTNIVKSVLDIPLLFIAAFLINLHYSYFFALLALISLIPTLLFPLRAVTTRSDLAV